MKLTQKRIEEIEEIEAAVSILNIHREVKEGTLLHDHVFAVVSDLEAERREREREIERLDERLATANEGFDKMCELEQEATARAEKAESENAALREQIEEVWKMTCEEKCGWNCCSHQIREFLSKKANE